jgi:PAS domain S-box-containing protein
MAGKGRVKAPPQQHALLRQMLAELDAREAELHGHVQEAHHLLAEARERHSDLYDFAPLPLLTLDETGVIREVNLAAAALFGGDRADLLGVSLASLVPEADRLALRRHMARCRRTPQGVVTSDLAVAAREGGWVPARVVSQRASDGRQAFWTALVDLTDRKRLETEQRRMRDSEHAAREASEAKNLFIAVLSHELRAPLTTLLSAAARLERGNLEEAELLRLGATIRRSATAQARLVEDLLDLTRLTRAKVRLELAAIDVHTVAREVVDTLAPELRARKLAVVLDLRAARQIIDGDERRLRQVFINLIKNAIKFTPEGGRVAVRSWNNEERLVVEVSDTGIGIAPAALERIFAPYEQARSGVGGGVGLGLAIVKEIVDLHRGRIVATSAGPGKGARFVMELATMPAQATRLTPAASPRPHKRRTRRILIVEDNPDMAESLTIALQSEGYEVKTASSLRSALAVDLDRVDLVLSDIQLPDGRGVDLVRKLRGKRAVAAIALSGYAASSDIRASKKAGFAAHFGKPVDMPALLAAIRSATRPGAPARARRVSSQTSGGALAGRNGSTASHS